MPKRMIVTQPPPKPTPLPGGQVQPSGLSKKAAKEAVDGMIRAARAIPGVEAFAIGDMVKVRIRGESFADIAQKISMLPEEIRWGPSKTMCDGEPVRIT